MPQKDPKEAVKTPFPETMACKKYVNEKRYKDPFPCKIIDSPQHRLQQKIF